MSTTVNTRVKVEPGIYRRGGLYEIRVGYRDATGTRYDIWRIIGTSKREARRALIEVRAEAQKQRIVIPEIVPAPMDARRLSCRRGRGRDVLTPDHHAGGVGGVKDMQGGQLACCGDLVHRVIRHPRREHRRDLRPDRWLVRLRC